LGFQEQIDSGVAHREHLSEDVAFERIELGSVPGGLSRGFFEVQSHRAQAIGFVGRRGSCENHAAGLSTNSMIQRPSFREVQVRTAGNDAPETRLHPSKISRKRSELTKPKNSYSHIWFAVLSITIFAFVPSRIWKAVSAQFNPRAALAYPALSCSCRQRIVSSEFWKY